MKQKKNIGIEYICTGNNGRSPMADIIAKEYVRQQALDSKIKIYSSGTNAGMLKDDDFLLSDIFPFIKDELKNKNRDVIDVCYGVMKELAEKAIDEKINNQEKLRLVKYLIAQERTFRNFVLLEWGYSSENHFNQQTIARDDVDLILPFGKDNVERAKKIYEGKEKRIILLDDYVQDYETVYTMLVSMDIVKKTRDTIDRKVRKSIDKAVEGYLR